MTEAEALVRLSRMTASSNDPELTAEELDDLLSMCKVMDADGRAPDDEDWEPTWDLNRGAAEGWRWKAAKAASRFDFTADGASFDRSQITEHCERMARQYSRRITSNVELPGPLATEA
ncbi:MAG: hypothetical protein DRO14_00560 [Thermoprotei archaeon]|nr:MAG: hypothetical protein DRO14_00560 [Thermoprotei archaeon]